MEGRDEETPKDKLESVKKRTNKRDHRDFNTLLKNAKPESVIAGLLPVLKTSN